MEESPVRVRAVVQGMVQGVGFRAFVLDHAEDLELRGTVRNRVDGAVEVVVEGPRTAVERLLSMLRRGPSSSRVDRVEVADEPAGASLPPMRVTA